MSTIQESLTVRNLVELLRRWERLYPDLKPQTLNALHEFNELYVQTSQTVHTADKVLTVLSL